MARIIQVLLWSSLFARFNRVFKALGGNESDERLTGSRRIQREGLLDHLVLIHRAPYDASFNC